MIKKKKKKNKHYCDYLKALSVKILKIFNENEYLITWKNIKSQVSLIVTSL